MPAQMPFDFDAAQARHSELTATLREADRKYFREEAPAMPDDAYDALAREADGLRARHPQLPERPVGFGPDPRLGTVRHRTPMMSLENASTPDDVARFAARAAAAMRPDGATFTSELKIDGLSLSIVYEGRALVRAATRGDRAEGEDVTAAARNIEGLPLRLPEDAPEDLEVRGEAYMRNEDFDAANDAQRARGAEPYKTPRNAASGAIRKGTSGDPRKVRFQAYQAFPADLGPTQEALLAKLAGWGFETPPALHGLRSAEDLMGAHRQFGELRPSLPFEIDGVVHKVASIAAREAMPGTSRTPGWAIAHKFPPAQASTTLAGITVQVGRSGTLTPVAELAPVRIGGVVVSRATLHNADNVARLDARPGDAVLVERAGDVIPKVVAVTDADREGRPLPWAMPAHCPSCGARAARDPEAAATRCTNAMSCGASALARFEHLAGRDVLDIDGLGEGAIADLIALGVLRTPADLYRLRGHRLRIASQAGWGDKSADALLAAVERARRVRLSRLVTSLGIREIGRTAGRLIEARFETLGAALSAMRGAALGEGPAIAALSGIDGIGPKMVSEIAQWFGEPQNVLALDDLLSEVTVLPYERPEAAAGHRLAGKTVVFTGTLDSGTREAAEAKARSLGARTSSSISAKTDFLVAGRDAGSKLSKAQALRDRGSAIETLSEAEWEAIAG